FCCVCILLAFLTTASSERNFDYDDDDLDHEESLLWETSDTNSMGPTRPTSNKLPVEGVLNVDPHLHRQISDIVRSVMAEYTQKNPMPGGIWVSTKPMMPEPQGGFFQNPCVPARLQQIPLVPWKSDNNHVKEPPLPPQSLYPKQQQQQQWRTVPMFPLPAHLLPAKHNYAHPPPGVKTSFSISTSHPVPLQKQEVHPPPFARDWRSQGPQAAAQPMEQRPNGPVTVPPPIRPPKLAPLRFRQSQRLQEANNLRSSAQSPLKVPASVPKPAPLPSDAYYSSQAAKPRKVVKQVFFTNRKPATAATSKTGQWYKMPVEGEGREANAAGEDRKTYQKQEDRAEARARKQELKKAEDREASQFHYIHIEDRK
ncbi:unnamed protein product, partial [Ixodes hexagonus]